MKEEFYTEKRWLNWIDKVRDSKFKMPASEDFAGSGGAVFVNIMDDVVLACLKVIARWERELITRDEALATIEGIRGIVSMNNESLGEDADMMLDSLKTSLVAVFVACSRYIAGDFDRDSPIPDLVKDALSAEAEERIDDALGIIGSVGARVIAGEALPETPEMAYCIVAELMDGVDAIAAAMLGDQSYKEEDGSDLGDEI